ncbi:MAG: hypothetical protein HeimC3_14660 [Candidatus Heimdallarchaeota archaeon LC_3]|nr:MAG: hypothetical protein HeimC3_14660 [Candidatus Heimdallarchaeota archaeon LC_3]
MSVFSLRIDPELKKKMDQLKHINWNEIVREFLKNKVEIVAKTRTINLIDRKNAIALSKALKQKSESENNWNSTEELQKWRNYFK